MPPPFTHKQIAERQRRIAAAAMHAKNNTKVYTPNQFSFLRPVETPIIRDGCIAQAHMKMEEIKQRTILFARMSALGITQKKKSTPRNFEKEVPKDYGKNASDWMGNIPRKMKQEAELKKQTVDFHNELENPTGVYKKSEKPIMEVSEIDKLNAFTRLNRKINPLEVQEIEREVMRFDPYVNSAIIGKESEVNSVIGRHELNYNEAVANNISGGPFGALGYMVDGDRGSFYGAVGDQIAFSFGGMPEQFGYLSKPSRMYIEAPIQYNEFPRFSLTRISGPKKDFSTGVPNSIYTYLGSDRKAVSNFIYNGNGEVSYQTDFGKHGSFLPGHGHIIASPGVLLTGHDKLFGNHVLIENVPPEYLRIPKGVEYSNPPQNN